MNLEGFTQNKFRRADGFDKIPAARLAGGYSRFADRLFHRFRSICICRRFPQIAADFGVEVARVELSLATFFFRIIFRTIAFTARPPTASAGKKPLYVGLSIYCIASIVCAFTPNVENFNYFASVSGFRRVRRHRYCAGDGQRFVRSPRIGASFFFAPFADHGRRADHCTADRRLCCALFFGWRAIFGRCRFGQRNLFRDGL